MANVSLREVNRLRGQVASMRKRTAKLREEAAHVVGKVLRTTEVGGAAFAFGAIAGRMGEEPKVFGVPADLLAGAGLHVVSFLGVSDGMGTHIEGLADGCIAAYFHTLGASVGRGIGRPAAATEGEDQAMLADGEDGEQYGMNLTDEEIAALAVY